MPIENNEWPCCLDLSRIIASVALETILTCASRRPWRRALLALRQDPLYSLHFPIIPTRGNRLVSPSSNSNISLTISSSPFKQRGMYIQLFWAFPFCEQQHDILQSPIISSIPVMWPAGHTFMTLSQGPSRFVPYPLPRQLIYKTGRSAYCI